MSALDEERLKRLRDRTALKLRDRFERFRDESAMERHRRLAEVLLMILDADEVETAYAIDLVMIARDRDPDLMLDVSGMLLIFALKRGLLDKDVDRWERPERGGPA